MAGLDVIETPKLVFIEGAAPGTPAAGIVYIYAKADGLLYSKDDAGTETVVSGGGSLADHNHTAAGGDGGDLDAPIIDGYAVFNEESAPSTPASGTVAIYAKSDGLFYSKDDAGAETLVSGGAGGGGGPTLIRKTADQVVNNSSTLVNDTHLLVPLLANEVWAFDGVLWYDAHASADLKVGWTFPAGASLRWMVRSSGATGGEYSLSGPGILDGTAQALFGRGVGTMACATVHGVVINGATPGDLQLQWAQNAAHVSDSTLHDNSLLIPYQLA